MLFAVISKDFPGAHLAKFEAGFCYVSLEERRDFLCQPIMSMAFSNPHFQHTVNNQLVRDEITRLEATEEVKSWMSLGSRDKSALMTLPQLLKVIEENWKEGFDDLIRDKGLIQEARLLGHLRNTICHMNTIPVEEVERIKQTMWDWFRVVAP